VHDQTKYARSGELWIAYQVIGDGPVDLLWAPGYMSHVEQNWTWPPYAAMLERMASFSRLIKFDRRGTGLSDRSFSLGSFDEMMDDIASVLDAASSERAALFGGAEGGPMCALFAATYPERTAALILGASYARRMWASDYPWGLDEHGALAHTNHYVHPRMLSYEGDPEYAVSSSVRFERACALLADAAPGAIDAAWLRAAISDHATSPAICRHKGDSARSHTVFWCIADVTAGDIRYGAGPPCDSVEQRYAFS